MTRPLGKVYEEVCLAGLHRKSVVQVAVLLAACLSPILAFAQNDIWKGGTGKWSDSTKWSAGVPSSSSNVLIGNGIGSGNSFINQGTVNANQTTPLTIAVGAGTVTNTGTLEATNGATLTLNGGGTVTNTGGTIHADPSSIVTLQSGLTISGGTLTTSGTGTIQANCCFNDGAINGVTINGTFQVNDNIQHLGGG